MGAILIGFIGLGLFFVSVIYLTPILNKAFGLIWTDPSVRQKREVLARIREMSVHGDMPPEAAALIASAEKNVAEEELFALLDTFGAQGLAEIAAGKRSAPWALVDAVQKSVKKNAGRGCYDGD